MAKNVILSYFIFIIMAIVVLSITYLSLTYLLRFLHIYGIHDKRDWSLHHDGIVRIPKVLTEHDLNRIQHLSSIDETLQIKDHLLHPQSSLRRHILPLLPDGYEFHDYIFFIRRSQFHTCHRDYNGDLFHETQLHPSYTLIVYLSDMDRCLDVIPGSHRNLDHDVGMTDWTQTVHCLTGDVLLFNANLVHSGSLNDGAFPRVQLKISHRDDMEVLNFYTKYNKVMNEESGASQPIQYLQKHLTCTFPGLSTLTRGYDANQDATKTDSEIAAEKERSLIASVYYKLDEAK